MTPQRGYCRDRAQRFREEEIENPKLTIGEVLDALGAFAEEFESFEWSDTSAESQKVSKDEGETDFSSRLDEAFSCPDKAECSSDGSTSSLDEIALMYAELEDKEIVSSEHVTAEEPTEAGEQIQDMDEITSSSKGSDISSNASASPPNYHMVSSQPLGPFEAPIHFGVYTDINGRIICIETEIHDAPYQYHINISPGQLIREDNLKFFMQVIMQEQSNSATFFKYFTEMADHSVYDFVGHNLKIIWLPTLIRKAVSEMIYEQTHRFLTKWLPKTGLATMKREHKMTTCTSKVLEMFFAVTRHPNEAEAYLFLHMNNSGLSNAHKASVEDFTNIVNHRRTRYRATHALLGGFLFLTCTAVLSNTLIARGDDWEELEGEDENEEDENEEDENEVEENEEDENEEDENEEDENEEDENEEDENEEENEEEENEDEVEGDGEWI